jgi:transcriptional regulator with XRE-family HTH domain
MDYVAHLGARLAARRRSLSLSEAGLASKAGVEPDQLAAWEAGAERIPARNLVELAKLLGCDITYFFVGLPGAPQSALGRYLRLVGGTDLDPAAEGS